MTTEKRETMKQNGKEGMPGRSNRRAVHPRVGDCFAAFTTRAMPNKDVTLNQGKENAMFTPSPLMPGQVPMPGQVYLPGPLPTGWHAPIGPGGIPQSFPPRPPFGC